MLSIFSLTKAFVPPPRNKQLTSDISLLAKETKLCYSVLMFNNLTSFKLN